MLAFAYKLILEGHEREGFNLSYNVATPAVLETLSSTLWKVYRHASVKASNSRWWAEILRTVATICGAVAIGCLAIFMSVARGDHFIFMLAAIAVTEAIVCWSLMRTFLLFPDLLRFGDPFVGIAGTACFVAVLLFVVAPHYSALAAGAAIVAIACWGVMRVFRARWILNRHKYELCTSFELRAVCDPALWSGQIAEWQKFVAREVDRISGISFDQLRHWQLQVPSRSSPPSTAEVLPTKIVDYVLKSLKAKRLGIALPYYWAFIRRYQTQARPNIVAANSLQLFLAIGISGYIAYCLWRSGTSGDHIVVSLLIFAVALLPLLQNLVGAVKKLSLRANELVAGMEDIVASLTNIDDEISIRSTMSREDVRALYENLLACQRLLDAEYWHWFRWHFQMDELGWDDIRRIWPFKSR